MIASVEPLKYDKATNAFVPDLGADPQIVYDPAHLGATSNATVTWVATCSCGWSLALNSTKRQITDYLNIHIQQGERPMGIILRMLLPELLALLQLSVKNPQSLATETVILTQIRDAINQILPPAISASVGYAGPGLAQGSTLVPQPPR